MALDSCLCVVSCCVLCFDLPCPLVSLFRQCLLCIPCCSLSPSVCQCLLLCASPPSLPHLASSLLSHLTCSSSLVSVYLDSFPLVSVRSLLLFLLLSGVHVQVMSFQSSQCFLICVQSLSGMCFFWTLILAFCIFDLNFAFLFALCLAVLVATWLLPLFV